MSPEPFRVMVDCDAGTMRLIDDTTGCRWVKDYHVITWANYATYAEAEHAARGMCDNPTVRRVWIEEDKAL